jgi:ADP-ribose pyrophosphatase
VFSLESLQKGLLLDQSKALYAPTGTKYKGTPWTNDRTVSVTTLGETKFARCDVHTVKSEDGKYQINDWLFMEEADAVNVAVVTGDGNFVVFEQSKYAIPGSTLSPVGGFVDDGEAPWESAKREVLEELGLGSKKTLDQMKSVMKKNKSDRIMDATALKAIRKQPRTVDNFNLARGDVVGDDDWIFLGRYRTAANRGGGFIYTYLLKNAVSILPGGGTVHFKGSGDDERQLIKILPIGDVKRRTMNGDFQEVKWAATLALALMHLGQ